MDTQNKYRHGRLIFGLVALLSASFLTRAPFEKTPQDCELISVIKPKKKNDARKGDE